MTVRCKFHCNSVTKQISYDWETKANRFVYAAKFNAVTGELGPENKSFFAATPAGQLEVQTVKDDIFEVGKDYYLDLTLAD